MGSNGDPDDVNDYFLALRQTVKVVLLRVLLVLALQYIST